MSAFTTSAARDRFEGNVDRSGGPDACHPYVGTIMNAGYGLASTGTPNERQLAHRLAFVEAYGEIPEGHHVDHECHNETDCAGGLDCPHRRCCNPRHLGAKLPEDNRAASHRANERKTHCPRGHEYTPANTIYQVKASGTSRKCRECQRDYDRNRRPRRVRTRTPERI